MADQPNHITPAGYAALGRRYAELFEIERPRVVETVSWAAGNGDRSENGDYIYSRQRLRAIDRELNHLSKRMKAARVVDPARVEDRSRVRFGATVAIADERDGPPDIVLVEDEADAAAGRISWRSPLAEALKGAAVGDTRRVRLPGGERAWEIVAIDYPPAAA